MTAFESRTAPVTDPNQTLEPSATHTGILSWFRREEDGIAFGINGSTEIYFYKLLSSDAPGFVVHKPVEFSISQRQEKAGMIEVE